MTIGIFDSGFGGLTILKEISKLLPHYDYTYLGDNARAPYGDRSQEVIYQFTRQGVEHLFKQDCSLVILACNSASALALRRLQQEWLPTHYPDRKILGIIIPVIEHVIQMTTPGKIGVIATRATVTSHVFQKELEKHAQKKITLLEEACPLLVPLIEEGSHESIPARMILKSYLRPLKNKQIKTLILGCTHYPILLASIKRIMGKNVTVIVPGVIAANALKAYLATHPEIEMNLSKKSSMRLLTTDLSQRITAVAHRLMARPLTFERCVLED